jgi:hypothetical protein
MVAGDLRAAMSRSAEWITSEYIRLKSKYSPRHAKNANVLRTYKGGLDVALPELDEREEPAIANLLAIGIDGMATRVASVLPVTIAPALRPGIARSEALADQRRQAVDGWQRMNHVKQKQRRRARHLVAYGTSPISISPVAESSDPRKIPWIRVRNPMLSYPAEMHDLDNIEPDYCIFVGQRDRRWLEDTYPAAMRQLCKGTLNSFDVLEYVDCDEFTWVVVGAEQNSSDRHGEREVTVDGSSPYMLLTSEPNRTGICPVVFPGRITLDGTTGQFDSLIGLYQMRAKLSALLMIDTQRNVFSDEWVESIPNSGSKPRITTYADGLSGTIGIVENGRINRLNAVQNQAAQLMLDQLERAERMAGDIPAEWNGESGSNIRTARRGADVLASATDMPIQEIHEIFELSDEAMFRRMIAVQKTYYGHAPSMFFIPADGKIVKSDYTPNDAFETDQVWSRYALPGTDAASMTVAFGQKIGMGVMSAETAMELDPTIDDPHLERSRIYLEGVRRALLTATEQQASGGTIDPHTIALIALALAKPNSTLESAVDEVHKAMQAEQAAVAQAQTPPPTGAPGAQPGGPPAELMPGMQQTAAGGPPGQTSGIAGGPPTVPPPSGGATDLMNMLKTAHPPAPVAA